MERRRARGRWLGWGIPLLLLLAFLLYFVLGAVLPNQNHRSVSSEFEAAAEAAVYTAESPGGETVRYISDNREAMALRLAMAEAAEEEIILSTFDFDADEPGCQLLSALLHAAERGVQVKVLVDGVSGWMDVYASPWFQALAAHPNAEVKIYNPITSLEPWRDMYRLHDKYFIVDGEMYLLGGRNSTDLFLGEGYPGQNLDSEVLVRRNEPRAGDSTEQLLSYFESIWALDECQTVAVTHPAAAEKKARELNGLYDLLPQSYPEAFEPGWLEGLEMLETNRITLLSNPIEAENKAPELWEAMMALLRDGDDILVYTPYVILSDEMMSDLSTVAADSESFTMILNDPTGGANPFGCMDYLNQKEAILSTGVTVGEYLGEHSLHTKNVLVDDRLCLVGSFNFDMRSAYLDTELMLAIDSEGLNAQLRQRAEDDLDHCRLVSAQGETLGAQFVPRELTGGKALVYQVLRRLIIPFRCLL